MTIKLKNYEGPLQLLYDSIKKNKISIYDVSIVKIVDQYISLLQQMDMDSKSEFILLTSELVAIKTKLLLRIEDEDEDEDPLKELAFRLEVYEAFANISESLGNMQQNTTFYRKGIPEAKQKINITHSTISLMEIFKEVLLRQLSPSENLPKITLETEKYSLKESVDRLQHLLNNKKVATFSGILKTDNVSEKVVMFLALLELIREKKVIITQNENFNEIIITYG